MLDNIKKLFTTAKNIVSGADDSHPVSRPYRAAQAAAREACKPRWLKITGTKIPAQQPNKRPPPATNRQRKLAARPKPPRYTHAPASGSLPKVSVLRARAREYAAELARVAGL